MLFGKEETNIISAPLMLPAFYIRGKLPVTNEAAYKVLKNEAHLEKKLQRSTAEKNFCIVLYSSNRISWEKNLYI